MTPPSGTRPVATYAAQRQFSIADDFRSLASARHVVWELLKRDLASQYRQSAFGVLLSLLPALSTCAWAILFQNAKLISVGATSVPYPFFVVCGMMIWATFLESIDAPIQGVLSELHMLSGSSVPPEVVTFARLGQVFVNLFAKTVVVGLVAIFYQIHLPWTALLAPLGVLVIVAMGAGIGLVLAPINLLYRDIAKAIPMVTTFWFFLTPIIFVPPTAGVAAVIMRRLNPVSPLLTTTRDLLFPGSAHVSAAAVGMSIFAVTLFCVALIFHRVAMRVVIDRSNA